MAEKLERLEAEQAPAPSQRGEGLADEQVSPSKRAGAPMREATHATELVGEIVVRAPDGAARVPFSVAVTPDARLLVFSFLKEGGGSVLDRYDIEGRHLATVARFASGDGRGQIRAPAGVALDAAG